MAARRATDSVSAGRRVIEHIVHAGNRAMRWAALLALVAALAVTLAGCGRTESYRYKLTLAVNTPDGVRRASSVVEVMFWAVSIPERGIMHRLRGEALYLDLGPGARPLVALLTSYLHPASTRDYLASRKALRWTRDEGPGDNILAELYGRSSAGLMDEVARIARIRGPHKISPADLPDLVTLQTSTNRAA